LGSESLRAGLAFLIVLAPWSTLAAAPVEVRLVEGTAHGLLLVRSMSGQTLGHGDFLQTAYRDRVESRLILRFKDGSLHDERVAFSQQRVFAMLSYRLVQRGPSFPETLEVALDRKTGSYTVRSMQGAHEQAFSGSIELPPDVYNGMVVMLLKNLALATAETVHIVAFTPKPRLIQLEMVPAGKPRLLAGDVVRQATRYALKPKLGAAIRFFAILLGKAPPDQECVLLTEDVPAFVHCDGPLYLKGPVWRIEMTSAHTAARSPTSATGIRPGSSYLVRPTGPHTVCDSP
jgi:hypothetical protein